MQTRNYAAVSQRVAAALSSKRTYRWAALALLLALLLIGAILFMAGGAPPVAGSYHAPGAPASGLNTMSVPSRSAANPTPAPTVEAVGDGERPSGSPVDALGWQVVKDYAATGGPGNRGAVEIGLAGGGLSTPVHATHPGLVKTLKNDPTYGNLVYVIGNGYTTIYGHLQGISVSNGQAVKRGDTVGALGRSGAVSGPELNYQVWQCSGSPAASGTAARICTNVDPAAYLRLRGAQRWIKQDSLSHRCSVPHRQLRTEQRATGRTTWR